MMLDVKFVRENLNVVRKSLEKRGMEADLDRFAELDEKKRKLLFDVEQLKYIRNRISGEIAELKRVGKDAQEKIISMRELSQKIKSLDAQVRELDVALKRMMLDIPNIPHPSVPMGIDERDNEVIRYWGEPPKFDFEPKAHWDIGTKLGILDFRASG